MKQTKEKSPKSIVAYRGGGVKYTIIYHLYDIIHIPHIPPP